MGWNSWVAGGSDLLSGNCDSLVVGCFDQFKNYLIPARGTRINAIGFTGQALGVRGKLCAKRSLALKPGLRCSF